MRVTEVLMSIPSFYLLISLRAILPTVFPHITYLLIVVILSFIGWPGMSRVIRGMVLGLKETEFVQAAIARLSVNPCDSKAYNPEHCSPT